MLLRNRRQTPLWRLSICIREIYLMYNPEWIKIIFTQLLCDLSIRSKLICNKAKNIKRKNRLPQNLPPPITLNILGSVINSRLGPLSGFTPKLKQAGKIIKPAIKATTVSRTPM